MLTFWVASLLQTSGGPRSANYTCKQGTSKFCFVFFFLSPWHVCWAVVNTVCFPTGLLHLGRNYREPCAQAQRQGGLWLLGARSQMLSWGGLYWPTALAFQKLHALSLENSQPVFWVLFYVASASREPISTVFCIKGLSSALCPLTPGLRAFPGLGPSGPRASRSPCPHFRSS